MAKNEIATQGQPGYLAKYEGNAGLEEAQRYIVPPMLKIVQKQSETALLEQFGMGSVIVTPANSLAFKREGSLNFTPLLFKPSYLTWNSIDLKGIEDAILASSDDPNGDLARKARDSGLRNEVVTINGRERTVHHTEHLNFLVHAEDENLNALPLMLSFSRTAWKDGSNFLSALSMRNAPIFASRWKLSVAERSNQKGSWFVFNVAAPDDGSPWAEEDDISAYAAMHEKLKSATIKTGESMTASLETPSTAAGSAPIDAEATPTGGKVPF